MSRLFNFIIAISLAAASTVAFAQKLTNVGRTATPQEIEKWNIDVRPDFKGLPKGSGTVAKGQGVWEGKCASCHGTFGESNEVFTPIVGGTTDEDIKTGHVAALKTGTQPQVTTLMKVATVSTLWDYINRAMPWTAPKSLSHEEVYSVVAYILNMGGIVPDDFTLSDKNIADVQKRMPNRNGMETNHGMWDVKGKPDVKSVACMKNCKVEGKVVSELPDVARNAHGDIAEQTRNFGEAVGVDTTKPPVKGPQAKVVRPESADKIAAKALPATAPSGEPAGLDLVKKNGCVACHSVDHKIVGPSFIDIAAKFKGNAAAEKTLMDKVKNGSSGVWGSIPMPPQNVKDDELKVMVDWILKGAK